MTPEAQTPRPRRKHLFAWLSRANAELSGWAAATSWWRLIILFVVVLIAAQLIADQLHLKHPQVRVATSGRDGDIRIPQVGPDGVRITRRRRSDEDPADASPPDAKPADAGPPAAPGVTQAPRPPTASDDDEDDEDSPRGISSSRVTV